MPSEKAPTNVFLHKHGEFPGTMDEFWFAQAHADWTEATYTDPYERMDGVENDCRE